MGPINAGVELTSKGDGGISEAYINIWGFWCPKIPKSWYSMAALPTFWAQTIPKPDSQFDAYRSGRVDGGNPN